MRCTSCYTILPKGAEVCNRCGKRFAPASQQTGQGFQANEIRPQPSQAVTMRTRQPSGCMIRLCVMGIIFLIPFIAIIFNSIQRNQDPVKFTQTVDNGDPVYCYLSSVNEPQYTVSVTGNSYTTYISDYATVLCKCRDTDGNTFWMAIDYKDYKKYFSSTAQGGKKVLGYAKEADDLANGRNPLGDILVFDFDSVE